MPSQGIEWIPVFGDSRRQATLAAEATLRAWSANTGIPFDRAEQSAMAEKVTIPGFFGRTTSAPSVYPQAGAWTFTLLGRDRLGNYTSPWQELGGIVITRTDGRQFVAYKSALPGDPYEFARIVTTLARDPTIQSIGPVRHTANEAQATLIRTLPELYAVKAGVYATVRPVPLPIMPLATEGVQPPTYPVLAMEPQPVGVPTMPIRTPVQTPQPTTVAPVSAVTIGAVAFAVGLGAYLLWRRMR